MFLYPLPTPILPTLNGFSTHKKPIYASIVAETVSKREITAAVQAYPLWEFELTYEELASQGENQVPYRQNLGRFQLEQMLTVFLACKGQYGRFYYDDPSDDSRAGQALGTGNGSNATFQAVRTIGVTSGLAMTEPVGGVNIGQPWKVYLNAVDDSSNWTVSANFTSFVRSSPPGGGVAVTVDFSFFYLCRFIEDINDFNQFYYNLWELKSLKFRSTKP